MELYFFKQRYKHIDMKEKKKQNLINDFSLLHVEVTPTKCRRVQDFSSSLVFSHQITAKILLMITIHK